MIYWNIQKIRKKWWGAVGCRGVWGGLGNTLLWRHNERDGVSNHQPHHCLHYRLFVRTSQKTPKLCITGLCVGNSPVTGEFPAQMASNAENASIWWRHHDIFHNFQMFLTPPVLFTVHNLLFCVTGAHESTSQTWHGAFSDDLLSHENNSTAIER